MSTKITKRIAERIFLRDDGTENGGISHDNETLAEFIESVGKRFGFGIKKYNEMLVKCGIEPVTDDEIEAASDTCLHIDEIEKIVDKKIAAMKTDDWLYLMKCSIIGEIKSYWYDELKKSKHYANGIGYAYIGDAHGITDRPDYDIVMKQAEQVLNKLMEEKGIRL